MRQPRASKHKPHDTYGRIYAAVKRIPRGRVATYGQIAEIAKASGPRQVGYAMHALRPGGGVPWHRVINAQGEVSERAEPGAGKAQRALLEAEGVVFDARGRIALERYRWKPRGWTSRTE